MAINNPSMLLIMLLATFLCSSMTPRANAQATKKNYPWKKIITVDRSGRKGSYVNIQDAIDAVPSNNVDPIFIRIEAGVYKEKINVSSDKPFITLSGRKANTTIITWHDGGDIYNSPTMSVFANNFMGRYLTIQNTYGVGAQAVALRVAGDKATFYACRILSYQDTLLDDIGRHFYKNCYIEGGTDFICGNAASLFQDCHLHSISKYNGAITAQHRMSVKENTGFYFVGGKITGVKSCTLGRPWGPYSRVVFAQTYMSDAVLPVGWDDWGRPARERTVYYGEYECYGPGADRRRRVEWSRSLTKQEALPLMSATMIDGQNWIIT